MQKYSTVPIKLPINLNHQQTDKSFEIQQKMSCKFPFPSSLHRVCHYSLLTRKNLDNLRAFHYPPMGKPDKISLYKGKGEEEQNIIFASLLIDNDKKLSQFCFF